MQVHIFSISAMFSTSTQCKHWMFNSEEELNKLRENANLKHIQTYGRHINVTKIPTLITFLLAYLLYS